MVWRSRHGWAACLVAAVAVLSLIATAGGDEREETGATGELAGTTGERTQTPVVSGTAETGSTVTGPAPASAAPDLVRTGTCSNNARWRLELTQVEVKTKVRFEVHQSPVGHRWRVQLHHLHTFGYHGTTFFLGTRVAMGGGDLAVQQLVQAGMLADGLRAKAIDTQTGQVCTTGGWIL